MRSVLSFLSFFSLVVCGYRDHLSQFLHEFETLAKEHVYIEHVTNFTSPTAMKFYFRIELKDQTFHAALQPHIDLFHPELVVNHRDGSEITPGGVNIQEFLEGHLVDQAESRVLLHIKDNVVHGSIQTSEGIKYIIEPSSKHIKEEHDFHMIAYKLSDVKFNFTQPGNDDGHFCGHSSHKDEKTYTDKDFEFMLPKKDKISGESFQYSRKKRAATAKKICPLALIGDYSFYKMNNKEEANAINYMLSLVQQIDPLYRNQALDPSDSPSDDYKDYGFQVKYVEVIREPLTASSDAASYRYYVDDHLPKVSNLLKNFAYGNWKDYCLAHLFTNYDFDGGVLGLAYVAAASTSRVGGVCTKTYRDGTGNTKNLNVGLTTSVNYRRALLSQELVFVTGHEFGHNWGSSHDSDSSEECAPKNNRYMMYPAAVDGSQANNYLFSKCSRRSINDVLKSKADICFEVESAAFCGNGVIEENEECDAGMNATACCTTSCTLKSGAQCEDSNIECCENCKYSGADVVCLVTSWEDDNSHYCYKDSKCDGNGKCKQGAAVADNTACYDNGLCKSGNCTTFCEARGKTSCSCSGDQELLIAVGEKKIIPSECIQCCKDDDASQCKVFFDDALTLKYQNLTDGKLCGNGMCVEGVCKVAAQDVQEKFWEIWEQLDINMVARWFKNNIVFTIIVFSSIFWIPLSIFVDWLDDKYDLEDFIGTDDDEKEDKKHLIQEQSAV